MTANDTTTRPPVITAAQFVSEDYAAKIAADECEVSYEDNSATIAKVFKDGDAYIAVCVPNPIMVAEGLIDPGTCEGYLDKTGDYKFTVRWLQPAAATSEVLWDSLSADEQAVLTEIHTTGKTSWKTYLTRRNLLDYGLLSNQMVNTGDVTECSLTELGKRVLAQAAANAGGQGVIVASVTVPRDMLYFLEADNEALKAENTRLETALTASQQAWDTSETQWVHLARLLEMPYEETAPWEMVARVASIIADENARLQTALASAEARVDVLRSNVVTSLISALNCKSDTPIKDMSSHIRDALRDLKVMVELGDDDDYYEAAANAGGQGAGFWTELQALLLKYGENTQDHAAQIGTFGDIDGSIPIERRYTDGLRAIYLMALHVEKQETALAQAQAERDYLKQHETDARQVLIDDGAISQSSFTLAELFNQCLGKADYQKSQKEQWKSKCEALQTALTAAQARADVLRQAVKPFAETWENYLKENVFLDDTSFLRWYYNESDEENATEMHKNAAKAMTTADGSGEAG